MVHYTSCSFTSLLDPPLKPSLRLAIHHPSPAFLEVKTEHLFNHLTFPSASSSVTSCHSRNTEVFHLPFWSLHSSHLSSHSFLGLSSPCRKMCSNPNLERTLPCSSKYTQPCPANHYPELFPSNCILDAPLPCI